VSASVGIVSFQFLVGIPPEMRSTDNFFQVLKRIIHKYENNWQKVHSMAFLTCKKIERNQKRNACCAVYFQCLTIFFQQV